MRMIDWLLNRPKKKHVGVFFNSLPDHLSVPLFHAEHPTPQAQAPVPKSRTPRPKSFQHYRARANAGPDYAAQAPRPSPPDNTAFYMAMGAAVLGQVLNNSTPAPDCSPAVDSTPSNGGTDGGGGSW